MRVVRGVRRRDDGRGSGEGVRGERRVGREREHCQKKKEEEEKRESGDRKVLVLLLPRSAIFCDVQVVSRSALSPTRYAGVTFPGARNSYQYASCLLRDFFTLTLARRAENRRNASCYISSSNRLRTFSLPGSLFPSLFSFLLFPLLLLSGYSLDPTLTLTLLTPFMIPSFSALLVCFLFFTPPSLSSSLSSSLSLIASILPATSSSLKASLLKTSPSPSTANTESHPATDRSSAAPGKIQMSPPTRPPSHSSRTTRTESAVERRQEGSAARRGTTSRNRW